MRRLSILAVVILSVGGLITAFPAAAQPPPLQYPEAVSLSATTAAGTASRSFTVTAGEVAVTNLQFTPSPLTDAKGSVAVAAEAVTVNPAQLAQLEPTTSLQVTVSIDSLPEPGSYEGSISIAYDEQAEGTVDAIPLTLSVEPEAPTEPGMGPALRVEPEGQPLLLLLTSDGQNYRGSIVVTSLTTEVTGLKLTNFTDLTPTEGTAPPLLGADVTVTPSEPQTLGPGETQRFAVTFSEPSLPATYRGSVEITYDDKPTRETYVVGLELVAAMPTITIAPPDRILTLMQDGKSGSYKATFTLGVTEGEITSVTFTKSNLDRTDGQGRIFADRISVDPTTAAVGPGDPPGSFTVTVEDPEEGTYEGTLFLSYSGSAAEEAQDTVTLTLGLTASPEASLALSGPATIQIKGYLGEQVSRTLLLHETSEANDAKEVSFQAQDILGKEDQSLSLPAEAVTRPSDQKSVTVQRGAYGELPLRFDFGVEGARAGTFSGELIVLSDNAPDVPVTVEVALKHDWPWPLATLILGLLLGLYLTWYRSEYRDKDEQERSIEQLEQHLKANEGKPFHDFYGTAATNKLELARQMLTGDWPDGLEQAKALVTEVRGYRARWEQHHDELWRQRELIWTWFEELDAGYDYANAIKERLQTILDQRHTYQDSTAMKKEVDAERPKIAALQEARHKGDIVEEQLDQIEGELEGSVAHGYEVRIDQQEQSLRGADEDREVQAIEGQFDVIQADLQTAFEEWLPFYYHDEDTCGNKGGRCASNARQFISDVDGLSQSGRHWPFVKDKLEAALGQADVDIKARQHFARASQLAHNVWRAAWFYKEVIIPVRRELAQQNTSTDPWKAVLTSVQEIENWLAAANYANQTLDTFDQQLLVTWMETLYQKLGQAQGTPRPSPSPPSRPARPYRGLPDVSGQVTRYEFTSTVSVADRDLTVSGLPWVTTIQQWLLGRLNDLLGPLRELIGDPTVRYLSYQAAVTILSLVLLTGIGMLKLWADDATFGDSFLDYFTLFIWGFGANATKDSVLQVVKAWGGKTPIQ